MSVLSSVSICSDFSSLLRRSEEVRPAPSHHPLPLLWLKDFCSSCFIVFFSCPAEKLWLFLLLRLDFCLYEMSRLLQTLLVSPPSFCWIHKRWWTELELCLPLHERFVPPLPRISVTHGQETQGNASANFLTWACTSCFCIFFFFNFKYFLRKWIHLEEIFRC